MSRSVPVLGLLILVFCLTGCWRTFHAQQFQELPASKGFYGGSFLWEPWGYYGSAAGYHYVQYTYHRDNWVHSLGLRFPTNGICLRLQRVVPRQSDPVCALQPVLVEKTLTAFEWKPKNTSKLAFLTSGDNNLSNLVYFLEPLELKLAPPPRLEDYIGKP